MSSSSSSQHRSLTARALRAACTIALHTGVAAVAALTAPAAHAQPVQPAQGAQTYDFETVRPSCAGGPTITSYAGLTWTNAYLSTPNLGGGWIPGTTSGVCTAYNGFGQAMTMESATPFTLTSAQLTAGFRNGYQLRVEGFRLGQTTAAFQQVIDLTMTGARLVTFDFADVHSVRFSAANAGDGHFVMDDLTLARTSDVPVSPVPEPATWMLLASGLAGVAGLARRRRSGTA